MCTGVFEEMIAPTPPRANFRSQRSRTSVPDPSQLSKRPEMLERKMRFLTSRLRNRSGWKTADSVKQHLPGPRPVGLLAAADPVLERRIVRVLGAAGRGEAPQLELA